MAEVKLITLDINLVFTIINLIIFYFVFKKLVFGRVFKVIAKRKELIDGQFQEAATAQAEAETMKQQYEDSLRNAKDEAVQIVDQAKKTAQAEYDRVVGEASQQASKELANAQAAIAQERERTMQDMESQIADLAMVAATKILSDPDTYEKLLAETGA